MIYYKFCSSMLSSAVDLQGELSQAPGSCGVDSPGAEQSEQGIMELQRQGGRISEKPRYSHCGELAFSGFRVGKLQASWQTTY
jgi:hypothetical protein